MIDFDSFQVGSSVLINGKKHKITRLRKQIMTIDPVEKPWKESWGTLAIVLALNGCAGFVMLMYFLWAIGVFG